MARPDVKQARREQILDAFGVCIAQYGVDGTTLAKTADAAGLARPLVRHNVGNREDLLAAFVTRFLEQSRQLTELWISGLPSEGRLEAAAERLFDRKYSDLKTVQISNALLAASVEDRALRRQMRAWIKHFVSAFEDVITAEHPDVSPQLAHAVAVGVIGIYCNVEALSPLGDNGAMRSASRDAALLLLGSLQVTS